MLRRPGFTKPSLNERREELHAIRYRNRGLLVPTGLDAATSLERSRAYLDFHPHRIDEILQEAAYDSLRELYAFRVLTGLQEPIRVEEELGFAIGGSGR